MASPSLKFDPQKLLKGFDSVHDKAHAAIEMKVQTKYAPSLQSNAQINAKWTNRTGEARRRLNASYETLKNGYQLILAHGVGYGIWLELAHERKYAIIEQTIELVGAFEILPDFQNFLDKLKLSLK